MPSAHPHQTALCCDQPQPFRFLNLAALGVQGGPLLCGQPNQGDGDRALPGARVALARCLAARRLPVCSLGGARAPELTRLLGSLPGCMACPASQSNVLLKAYGRVCVRQPDVFFVLRVMQLLRGLAGGMGVRDFSSARQWRPIAERALRRAHYHADQAPSTLNLKL